MAKVVRFSELGGPEVLRIEEVEVLPPGPGEVRILAKALGLNRAEALLRRGSYIEAAALPSGLGLEAAGGDLSNGQAKFKEALNKLQLDSPIGKITLNENRQATGTVFVNEVVDGPDGNLTSKMVAKTENVNQTLGMTTTQFRAIGLPSRDAVDCAKLRAGG